MKFDECQKILNHAKNGTVTMLFVTPERLQNKEFLKAIKKADISFVAIDECHCVTSWGHGFRSDYLKIGDFIDNLPVRPVVAALTATASPEMRDEICDLLSMDFPATFVSSLHRKNLHFMKRSYVSNEAKLLALKRLLKKQKDGSCIIYCNITSVKKARNMRGVVI